MPMNVLVVDDSDIIRRMIVKTMRLMDLEVGMVLEAGNGREALEVLDDNWVDVVLADINMPVMDGFEMIEKMRSSGDLERVPVVVVSTEGAESRIQELERLGVSAYLRKPFTPEQIRDVLNRLPRSSARTEVLAIVEQVTTEMLERFAMMFAQSCADGSGVPHGELLLGRTGLRGATMGIVSVAAPLDLACEMAMNILGLDHDDDCTLRAADAVGEVANMVAGHIATELDSRAHTSLSPPIVTRLTPPEWESMEAADGTVRLDVEGRPLIVSMMLRD